MATRTKRSVLDPTCSYYAIRTGLCLLVLVVCTGADSGSAVRPVAAAASMAHHVGHQRRRA
eukprot:3842719-Rhodomonas_salina.2